MTTLRAAVEALSVFAIPTGDYIDKDDVLDVIDAHEAALARLNAALDRSPWVFDTLPGDVQEALAAIAA